MGRYYTLGSGKGGKFGFGVQPSSDPEHFGMSVTNIEYMSHANKEAKDFVRERLNECYDILGVPTEERLLKIVPDEEKHEYADRLWDKYVVDLVDRDEAQEGFRHSLKKAPYTLTESQTEKLKAEGKDPSKFSAVAKNEDVQLAYYRISLGLNILFEMESVGEDGLITLDAEP